MNEIFPPLNNSLSKHLWYLLSLGKISNKTVRKRITENIVKQELGYKSYPLRDEEAYIVATTEIEGTYGLTRDNATITDKLQQVLHGVGCRYANKTITLISALEYDHIVIGCVNKKGKNSEGQNRKRTTGTIKV